MMTLEDIRNIEFAKGRGYRAEEVDDFIDECVETVDKLTREVQAANQKVKTLADQVAEYRNEEDSIRAALLSAQRTGDTILREAEAKAKTLLEEATEQAASLRRELTEQMEAEKQELERVKRETAAFKAQLLELYKQHLAVIRLLPDEAKSENADEEPLIEPAETAPSVEEGSAIVVDPITEESARIEAEENMKPMSRFTDLKFGNDYDIREDSDDDDDNDEPSRGLFRKKK